LACGLASSGSVSTDETSAIFFVELKGVLMGYILSGVQGGVWATFVTAALMLMNNAIREIPELHIVRTLSAILGTPDHVAVAWLVFLAIGILLGVVFAVIAPRFPIRSNMVKGLLFGFAVWLGMMLLIMPLAGAGFFAVNRPAVVPMATLVLSLVYGMILATSYSWVLVASKAPPKKTDQGGGQRTAM